MAETISVTSETVDTLLPDLPRLVRLALGFGSKLKRGTLDVVSQNRTNRARVSIEIPRLRSSRSMARVC